MEEVKGVEWTARVYWRCGARGNVSSVLAFVVPTLSILLWVPISDQEPELLEGYGTFIGLGLAALGASDAGWDVGDDVSEGAKHLSESSSIEGALPAKFVATREANWAIHELQTNGTLEITLFVGSRGSGQRLFVAA